MLSQFLDWLLPPACAVCWRGGYLLCPHCQQQLCYLNPEWDLIEKLNLPHELQQVWAAVEYEALSQQLIGLIKYQGMYRYTRIASEIMVTQYGEHLTSWQPDVLVPVPLTQARARWRGYNQAHLLAYGLGNALGIPVSTTTLTRTRFQGSQTKLNKQARSQSAKHFQANTHSDKRICLVDDVLTTGSTLLACYQALLDQNPHVQLSCAVLAVAVSGQVPNQPKV